MMAQFYRVLIAGMALIALAFPIWTSFSIWTAEQRVSALQQGRLAPLDHARLLQKEKTVGHPQEWIETAMLVSSQTQAHDGLAIALLERVLAEDPRSAHAWAHLSFLVARQDGRFGQKAETALLRSFERCSYCEKSLLRWRFTYTLQHWAETSEETRLAAFSGADFLRWWHLDYDYLRDIRADALAGGIPFDAYRRKIDTPMRPNEIGR